MYAQADVPDEYWIDDSNFEDRIKEHKAFGRHGLSVPTSRKV